jgi:ribosomal protein S27AE
VFSRNARHARRLRTCPVCGSRAAGELTDHEESEGVVTLRLRCGACGTWRGAKLDWLQSHYVKAKLERRYRRDRRELTQDLRRLELAGAEPGDFGSPDPRPSLFL